MDDDAHPSPRGDDAEPPEDADPPEDAEPPEDAGTARRRRVPVAVLAAALGAALAVSAAVAAPAALRTAAGPAAPSTTAPPSPGPSPDPSTRTGDVAARLRTLPGVADAVLLGASDESARITLASPLPAPTDAQATADAASTLLADAAGGAAWSLRVEGTGPGGGSLVVEHGPGAASGGVDPATGAPLADLLGADAVADAVRLVAHDAVRRVHLAPGIAAVEARATEDLVAVAALARAEDRGLTSLVVEGYGVGLFEGDGRSVPDDALLALVTGAAALPSVTQVAYETVRSTVPADPLLTVVTSGPAADVARWLDDAAPPGPALAYQVQGSSDDGTSTTRSGFVGGTAPATADRPADACAPHDLTIAAAGVDAAAGRRFLTLTARNDGATPCALAGSPGMRFVADVGTETDVLLEPDDAAASPVVLEPGAAASALLSWRGGSTAGGPALVVTLLVAPHPGDPETVVPLTGVPGVGDGLDLLGGGTATVGAWALAG